MIDYFHKTFHPWDKPRTYRRVAGKEYLALTKSKKRTEKKIRATIRKQLECIRRDLGYLERYMGEGYALPPKYTDHYLAIRKLYERQKYMYDNRTHRVEGRIVSISQPYLRPVIRGKSMFIDAMEWYKKRTGHYTKRVLVDQIYRTRDNRKFCKDNRITMSGPKLGRPSKEKRSRAHHDEDGGDHFVFDRPVCSGDNPLCRRSQ